MPAHRRVIIQNGGMHKIIATNEYEKADYGELAELDRKMQEARNFFRLGNEYRRLLEHKACRMARVGRFVFPEN